MANLILDRQEWSHPLGSEFRMGEVSYSGFAKAEERGRQMAMQMLALNPTKRRECEAIWGLPYVKNRYPELYRDLKEGD